MEDNKISHAFWTLLTWVFTILCWSVEHIGAIAGLAAVLASVFSIRASRATERLRIQEQTNLAEKRRRYTDGPPPPKPPLTPPNSKEPDTET